MCTLNYSPEETGNAVYTTGLARGLADRKWDVTVVAGAPYYPQWKTRPQNEWESVEKSDHLTVRRYRSYVPKHPNFITRALFEILYGFRFLCSREVRRTIRDSDIIILVSPALLSSALLRLGVFILHPAMKTVLWTQDRYTAGLQAAGKRNSLAVKVVHKIASVTIHSVNEVVVIHERWEDMIASQFALEPKRIRTIRNWSHLKPVEHADVPRIRERMGWKPPSQEIIVLHAGNIGMKQGLENVVKAARLAEQERLPLKFVLLGDGNQRNKIESMSAGCSKIEFIEPLDTPHYRDALMASDVLLVNERASAADAAVPSKLTSYFMAGRPIIAATEAGSATADEVRSSGAGVVIEPENPGALAHKALEMNEKWMPSDALAGPAYVKAKVSETAALDAFEALLEDL